METIDVFMQDVNEFQGEFNDAIHAGQRLCFITRGKEFQIEAIDGLLSIKKKAEQLKERAIAHEYEDGANALLCFEEMTDALINELCMWIAIKEEKYAEAWDFLVNAQTAAINTILAHYIVEHVEDYIAHLSALEKHIFPNHGFLSIGAIVQKSECSICGQEHGTCDHLIGKPYMGKMCYEVVSECELEEISFVKIPSNKHCRVMSFKDDDGHMIDTFTLRVISGESPEKEKYNMAPIQREPIPGLRVTCDVTGRPRLMATINKDGISVWCKYCKAPHLVSREQLLDALLTDDEKQRLREPFMI